MIFTEHLVEFGNQGVKVDVAVKELLFREMQSVVDRCQKSVMLQWMLKIQTHIKNLKNKETQMVNCIIILFYSCNSNHIKCVKNFPVPVGPSLGMRKSSSLESLQTAIQEVSLHQNSRRNEALYGRSHQREY